MAQAPKFRPYRGKDATIQSIPYSNGYLYFATDTGRIYLDYNGERLTMGGNGASLFYANDTDVKQDLMDYYHIDISTLADENASVKINDLIINSDGAFYRVIETETGMDTLQCVRIAVSGSGGGGSGGGEGPSGPVALTTLVNLDPVPYTFIYGQSHEVRFKATAVNDTKIRITMTIDSELGSNTITTTVNSGEEFKLDIGANLFPASDNRIIVGATTDNSGSAEPKRFTGRTSVILQLKKSDSFNPREVVRDGSLAFYCVPVGLISKTLQVSVDGTVVVEQVIPASTSDSNYTVNVPKQSHGVHTVRAILTAEADGTVVTTDPIEYQIAWVESDVAAPLVWTPNGYPSNIVQYEDLIIEFMVWDPEKVNEIETHFYKNGIELPNSPRLLNYDITTTQRWNITDYEVGVNNYTIRVGSSTKPITVDVKEDTERDLSIITGGLVVNLDSSGRSNEENLSSKTSWVSKGTDVPVAVKFNNFNWYNNGWITDEDGRSCLRISNGASISIPLTGLNILNTQDITQSLAFEFRFKVRNIREYSTLVTTSSSVDENGNVIVTKEVSTEKGVWGRLFNNLGICLGTQEAFFKSTNTIVNARYREDEIINLSMVVDNNSSNLPLIYIYLQGILSGIAKYGSNDSFNANAFEMVFNSEYCDVDLYNVRIYRGAKLESADIVHNYIADAKDAKAYDANQITTTTNNVPIIDYKKMINYNTEHPDETILPYMIITSKDSDNRLPFVKGGKKAVDIEFHNPALDYAYSKGLITDEQYLHGAPSFTFSSKKKSLDVQGTSSQGYPRRNYKWKGKQEDAVWRYTNGPLKDKPIYEYNKESDKYKGSELNGVSYKKYYLDSDIGESTFCFKADYMESSGTHNTGYASYVSTLYNKHPLKDYLPANTQLPDSIRTTIYGFPMLVFQKIDANEYQFVGRYNFNLDKGATDTCGFSYEADSKVKDENDKFIPIEEIAECWEICNNQGERTSFTKTDYEETSDSYSIIELTSETFVPDTYYIQDHIDTSGNITYRLASEYNANDVYYSKVSGVLNVLNDFEYRYSFYEDEIDHAIEGTDEFAGKTQEERNAAILYRLRNLKALSEWLESTDIQNPDKLGATLPVPITIGSKTYDIDNKEYRLAKFAAEFHEHLDLEYCTIYFITTELFHLYDSRGKNCMLATWGPQVEGGNYIWYPIFYDIDTQLGINNSGVPTWEYFVEATETGQFSTSNSVIWNNMWQDSTFKNHIKNRYTELRKNNLTIDAMDGYYNSHPILGRPEIDSWRSVLENPEAASQLKESIISYAKIGKKPAMIYNVDQYYKYIAPAVSGYINTSGVNAYTESFFYCLQGTRELMRYLYLRNRLNFIDSKWLGGSYSKEGILGELKGRYDANNMVSTSDKYLRTTDPSLHNQPRIENGVDSGYIWWYNAEHGPNALDCAVDFKGIRTFLKQYVSIQIDETILTPIPCDGVNPVDLKVAHKEDSIMDVPAFTQQLFYLGGGEYIADLGDLGLKYLDEFNIPTLKRLQSLRLGSDVEGYYNAQLNSTNLSIGANAYNGDGTINKFAKTLLEEVVLTGLTTYNAEVDLSGSEKLKTFRALNTIITGVNLADGVQIETLHLPNTITSIKLIEPVALTGILTEPGNLTDGFNKGLYIEGITNAANYDKDINIITYDIVGGNLGYDSYKLLEILVNFKLAMQGRKSPNSQLAINLKDVNWSPYTLVEYGEPYDESKSSLYYYDNGRFELKHYDYAEATWEYNTKNGKIYLYNEEYFNANSDVLTDTGIFDTIIESYEIAKDNFVNGTITTPNDMSLNYFPNTVPNQTSPSIAEITGLVYINNTDPIDEAIVANEYMKYFPKVQFFFANVAAAYTATYVTLIDGVEEVIYTERKSADSEDLSLTYPSLDKYTPVRLNYDFMGWSRSQDGSTTVYHPNFLDNFEEEWAKLHYTSTTAIMKFYAIFEATRFAVHFINHFKDGHEEEITTEYVVAGEHLYAPPILPSTDESDLDDITRYKLLGYVADSKYCFPDNESEGLKHIVHLESIISENMDRTYYACYIKENVHDSITDPDLFTFDEGSYNDGLDSSYNISNGYIIQPRVKLSGKITIPGTYKGLPVFALAGTNGQGKLTHIYFEKPENMRYISSTYGNENLEVIDFPSHLRQIFDRGLRENGKLRSYDKLKDTKLYRIGVDAFVLTFDLTKGQIETFQLPGTLKDIGQNGIANFAGNPPAGEYAIVEFRFGGPGDPSQLVFSDIANNAVALKQNTLNFPPEGALSTQPIKRFVFYKDPSNTSPTQAEFQSFIESNKGLDTVNTGLTALEYSVQDA